MHSLDFWYQSPEARDCIAQSLSQGDKPSLVLKGGVKEAERVHDL